MNLKKDIREFIVDTFLFGEDSDLNDESSFLEEGIVDSTGIMQLVSFIQDQYRITIEDHELVPDNLDSIEKVRLFIETKIQAVTAKPEMTS